MKILTKPYLPAVKSRQTSKESEPQRQGEQRGHRRVWCLCFAADSGKVTASRMQDALCKKIRHSGEAVSGQPQRTRTQSSTKAFLCGLCSLSSLCVKHYSAALIFSSFFKSSSSSSSLSILAPSLLATAGSGCVSMNSPSAPVAMAALAMVSIN